jgi:hypothetical protein
LVYPAAGLIYPSGSIFYTWASTTLRVDSNKAWSPPGRIGLEGGPSKIEILNGRLYVLGGGYFASGKYIYGMAERRGQDWLVPNLPMDGSGRWSVGTFSQGGGLALIQSYFSPNPNPMYLWDGTTYSSAPTFLNYAVKLTEFQGKPLAYGVASPLGPLAIYENGTWNHFGTNVPTNSLSVIECRGVLYGTYLKSSTNKHTFFRLDPEGPTDINEFNNGAKLRVAGDDLYALSYGPLTDSQGVVTDGIMRWDGSRWLAMGKGLQGELIDVESFDGHLIVAGRTISTGTTLLPGLARWDGQTWQPFGSLVNSWISDICADGNQLHVAGSITLADGKRSSYFNTFSRNLPPTLLSSPSDLQLPGRAMAIFEARADGPALTYQWFRDGQPLVDGLSPSGARVYGSREARLRIEVLHQNDAGIYTCSITNACGQLQSAPASLRVCSADLNTDNTVSFEDFLLFFNLFDQSQSNADLNGDTQVDLFDFLLFFNSFDRGC